MLGRAARSCLFSAIVISLVHGKEAGAQCPGPVTTQDHLQITEGSGGFSGNLSRDDWFGMTVASVGDLDGDGNTDIVVGAPHDDDGGSNRGAIWVLFLRGNGTVRSHKKISDTSGNFTGALDDEDLFGWAVASLGDLDGDGVTDIVASSLFDDDGGYNFGAVWILFLHSNGRVKAHQKISATQGGFLGQLDISDDFGKSISTLDDLDGDGVIDLAVGAHNDDDGAIDCGAIWILNLNTDGTVKAHQKISNTQGGFTGGLDDNDQFAVGSTSLGDLNGDGVCDLAVGAYYDDDGGENRGAVWVLFLNPDGTVLAHQKISSTEGDFPGPLDDGDFFGFSLARLGDMDADGRTEIAVGALADDDGSSDPNADRGAVWILYLNGSGEVKTLQKFSETEGELDVAFTNRDWFGSSVACLGDFDGNSVEDLVVGARYDDSGGPNAGAVWLLSLEDRTTDWIELTGTEVAQPGAPIEFHWTCCPTWSPCWLYASTNLNGSTINGRSFDLGQPARVVTVGMTNAFGDGSWSSFRALPDRGFALIRRTVFFEVRVDSGGQTFDSNFVRLRLP